MRGMFIEKISPVSLLGAKKFAFLIFLPELTTQEFTFSVNTVDKGQMDRHFELLSSFASNRITVPFHIICSNLYIII